jgi:hypothetical protein
MKKVKINNTKVVDIVMETLKRDGVFVTKSKIDKVINGYLVEREEMLLDDEQPINDSYSFNTETKLAFGDMVGGVNDMIEDLSIVQVKESGVVVDTDLYSEDYLEDIITDLESIVERLEYLKGLK